MKTLQTLSYFIAACLLFLLSLGLFCYSLYTVYTGPSRLAEERIIVIPKGASSAAIAEKLAQEKIIRSALAFRLVTAASGQQASLKAGEYQFVPYSTLTEVIRKIETGDVFVQQVTIPEGWTSYRVYETVQKHNDLQGTLSAVPAEGALLPQTYRYQTGDTKQSIITRMENDMAQTLEKLWPARAADLPLATPQEALVLASIVEKETGLKHEERVRVAGVFINRLRKGMKLETDPTVIYALTKGREKNAGQGPLGRRLLKKDMDIDSPYNTYKYAGLPPGPICNPGEAAIKATLNPENHAYLYFVADGTGGHVFAETFAEHLKNVAKWRNIRARQ
ncbi:MAG: endolytic transglycosylase MltG [Alphaproteobacteria bacterium]|nr:endolytic transglycosylase MltG [Alphaproteobacteria bacterium]